MALLAACGVLSFAAAGARAGSLSSESSVGLSAEYHSNPYLLATQARGAEAAAAVLNLPVSYESDATSFDLQPRLRFAHTWGATGLLSDYQDVDGVWKLSSERNVYTVSGTLHRDSTFYNQFENAALSGRNVYRLEEDGTAGWQRQLSERSDVQLQGSFDHVAYDHVATNAGVAQTLGSYRYWQGSAQYDRSLTDLWQGTLSGGFGRYEQLDHSTQSDNSFAQLTLNRALAERWSVSAQGGYSRLVSHTLTPELFLAIGPNGPELIEELVRGRSSGGTASYGVNLERRSERGSLTLSASRSVQPSGFKALLIQNEASLQLSYDCSERLSLSAGLLGSTFTGAQQPTSATSRHYYSLDASMNWRLTEQWTLQTQATLTRQQQSGQHAQGASIYLTVTRQFGRVRLH